MSTEERFRDDDGVWRCERPKAEAWTARLHDPLLWALATTTDRRATLAMIRGWRWV